MTTVSKFIFMDISFSRSGALSTAHYALVRKIETAVSQQVIDGILLDEVRTIQRKLGRPTSLARELIPPI